MSRSEIAEAAAIVSEVTYLLDLVDADGEGELVLRVFAEEEALRLADPDAQPGDHALQTRIARTAARAAWRDGIDIAVVRLRAAPMRAWLARQAPSGRVADDYPGEPEDRHTGDAALRLLGLSAAALKEAPRKPVQGRTLAARIARWAQDPAMDEGAIVALTEELISARLDGALGVVERMLEPEDYALVRAEIDIAAATCVVEDGGRRRMAFLFASPVLREGAAPRPPEVPEGLGERLGGIALAPAFAEVVLAPFWIPTASLARLTPSDLRQAAESLANGLEPPLPRAVPADRDVCLFGLAMPATGRRDDTGAEPAQEPAEERMDAWCAAVAEAAGGGHADPPLSLARALDLLRRVKLAVPDGPEPDEDDDWAEEEDEDDGEDEPDPALVEALDAHLRGIGSGSALLAGSEDGAVAITVTGGLPDLAPQVLAEVLANALADGGVLFVVPAAAPGAAARGHAFLLEQGEAEGLSAGDAEAAFAEEAPADWAARPAGWEDAPALDYDPPPG